MCYSCHLATTAKTSVDLFNRPISLFRQMKSALTRANSTGGSSEQVTLVRLAPPLLVALRRMQRILQVRLLFLVLNWLIGGQCFSDMVYYHL